MAAPTAIQQAREQAADKTAVRPFRCRRYRKPSSASCAGASTATRFPDRETVTDATQGVQLATIQKLARYWATEYDWRKCEAQLKALPHFITEIDGLDIHFIHVRSKHQDALPMIVTHGWPGSIVEQLKIIGPLTEPDGPRRERGGRLRRGDPVDAGLRLLRQADHDGLGPRRIARAWIVLMKRLGYKRFVAQGGDWGAVVVDLMARAGAAGIARHSHQHARRLSGRHRRGGVLRRAGAVGSLRRREARLRAAAVRLSKGNRLRVPDGAAAADAVRNRGLADRPGGLFPRSRRAQLRADRARLRRAVRGPDARRRPRQHHDHLVDEHGVSGARLYWEYWGKAYLQCQRRLHPGCRERLPRRALSGPAELGGARRIPNSIYYKQARQGRPLRGLGAAASCSVPKTFARASDRFVSPRREGGGRVLAVFPQVAGLSRAVSTTSPIRILGIRRLLEALVAWTRRLGKGG